YGMGLADIRSNRQQAVEEILATGIESKLQELAANLSKDSEIELTSQGIPPEDITTRARVLVRYKGTDSALDADLDTTANMRASFEAAHKAQFGFSSPGTDIIVEAVTVESVGGGSDSSEPELTLIGGDAVAMNITRIYAQGEWHETPLYDRTSLKPGMTVMGPALIIEAHNTTVVEPGWQAAISSLDHMVLTRAVAAKREFAIGTDADPVMLEVFNNLFMSIAEQMGVTLEKTAYSVNIKERLDFSCAVFNAKGALVANAPHMPVHLGSMDKSVETIIANNPVMHPGDVFMLNAPYNGGTHLPDITVVTPVFDPDGKNILFYTASRGHHADVGGMAPGSMTPLATTIHEEGVVIDNFKMVDKGTFREQETHELLTSGEYPCRNPGQNIADLKAQVASNEKGVQELRKMIQHFGLDVVQAYMEHVQDNAEESVRRVIGALHDCEYDYEMDAGQHIRVKITVDRTNRTAKVDFTGTSEQQPNNFNAPRPVTNAAVLYVFRCMVADNIPMNAGCLKPITIITPQRTMLSPEFPAAVVAGNVEVSQAVTSCLFGALKAVAASQSTMNNFNFGNAKYQYYETICSGTGAGPGYDGTPAVHSHMTNTRLTDP
ncbi:MAG: hydantoinase B/oxoprolinase family protein, partial [Anderseniella sp.]